MGLLHAIQLAILSIRGGFRLQRRFQDNLRATYIINGMRYIQRILRDGGEHTTYANLSAVARALGMDFELKSNCDEQTFAERQAEAKAEVIVRMVQGTSALESQALDPDTYRQMVKQTVHELMAGPRRRLWDPM